MVSRDSNGQRRLRTGPWGLRPFVGAAIVLVLALAYEVLQTNEVSWTTRVRLLGVGPTVALLIATLGWLVARDQYARSIRPILRSRSASVHNPRHLSDGVAARQVYVTNNGPGIAVVSRVRWVLQQSESASETAPEPVVTDSIVELRAKLRAWGYTDPGNYWLANYSPGTSLRAGEDRLYFECTLKMMGALACFDAVFEFESVLGDLWERRISLLPIEGASRALAHRAADDEA